MLAASFLTTLGSIAMITVALMLIGLILLQKNRGSGLSGAFGGVGGHTAFGTKTGDFLTWVTVGLAIVFLLLAVALNFGFEPKSLTGATGAAAAPALPITASDQEQDAPAEPTTGGQPPASPTGG